jgi:hypothetical protein
MVILQRIFVGLLIAGIIVPSVVLALGNLKDIDIIPIASVVAVCVGLLLASATTRWYVAVAWCIAAFSGGCLLGLLFGIPKALRDPVSARPQGQQTNISKSQSSQATIADKETADKIAADKAAADKSAADKAAAAGKAAADKAAADKAAADKAAADKAATANKAAAEGAAADQRATVGDHTSPPRSSPYTTNTNLEDISDWLAKILVGLGLAQLGQIKSLVTQTGTYAAHSIDPAQVPSTAPLAASLIIYFTSIGFIASYLVTRTWLTEVLAGSLNP